MDDEGYALGDALGGYGVDDLPSSSDSSSDGGYMLLASRLESPAVPRVAAVKQQMSRDSGALTASDDEDATPNSSAVLPNVPAAEILRLATEDLGGSDRVLSLLSSVGQSDVDVAISKARFSSQMLLRTSDWEVHEAARDWQGRLDSAFEIEDDLPRTKALHDLTGDFLATATLYAEIIVSELALPAHMKSIKPLHNSAGVAGGVKFVVNGILFKVSSDHRFADGSWLYGGVVSDVEAAQKAAGHERKALQWIYKSNSSIGAPLMAVIDYRGLRISAQALIRGISSSTLVYGSSDGGAHVLSGENDKNLQDAVRALADSMGLAEHEVLERSTGQVKKVFLACDCEIHRLSGSGKLVLIDSARLFPPVGPNRATPRDIFFKLFRPEFLKVFGRPLSSDGFSRFANPADARTQNEVLFEATKFLETKLLPQVAEQLLRFEYIDITILPLAIQQRGVNIRYLGKLREIVLRMTDQTDMVKKIAKLLLTEMTARVIVKKLRTEWRNISSLSAIPFLRVTAATLNSVRVSDPPWLKPGIVAKFGYAALTTEEQVTAQLLGLYCNKSLAIRLTEMCGITLVSGGRMDESEEVFTASDLELHPVAKTMSFSSIAEAEQLRLEAKLLPRASARRMHLLHSAIRVLKRHFWSDESDMLVLTRIGRIFLQMAKETQSEKHITMVENVLKKLPPKSADYKYVFIKLSMVKGARLLKEDIAAASHQFAEAWQMFKSSESMEGWVSMIKLDDKKWDHKKTRLKERLLQVPLLIASNVFTATDLERVSWAELESLFDASSIFKDFEVVLATDIRVSQLFSVITRFPRGKDAAFDWLKNKPTLDFTRLSLGQLHDPFFDDFLLAKEPAVFESLRCLELGSPLSFAAFRYVLRCAPNVEDLTLSGVRFVEDTSIDLSQLLHVTSLTLRFCSVSPDWLFNRLPPQLEKLDAWRSVVAVDRSANKRRYQLPDSLKHVTLPENFEPSVELIESFPPGLLSYKGTLVPSLVRLKRLQHLENADKTGKFLEDPNFPELLSCRPGEHITDEQLLRLCKTSPLLESLNLSKCRSLSDEGCAAAISHVPRLKEFRIDQNLNVSSDVLGSAMHKAGIKLEKYSGRDAWTLNRVQLFTTESPTRLALAVLFGSLSMFTESLRWLELHDVEPREIEGSTLRTNFPNLETLKVTSSPCLSDEFICAVLSSAVHLQRLTLFNMPHLTENAFPSFSLQKLKKVKFRNTFLATEPSKILGKIPNVFSLYLEGSLDCNDMFDTLSRCCLGLSRLFVISNKMVDDPTRGLRRLFNLRVVFLLTRAEVVGVTLRSLLEMRVAVLGLSVAAESLVLNVPTTSALRKSLFVASFARVPLSVEHVRPLLCFEHLTMLGFAFTNRSSAELESVYEELRRIKSLEALNLSDMLSPVAMETPYQRFPSWLAFRKQTSIFYNVELTPATVASLHTWMRVSEKKELWAFVTFFGDEFSLLNLMDLAHRGYNVIVCTVSDEERSGMTPEFGAQLARFLGPDQGVYWLRADPMNTQSLEKLREDVGKLTQAINVAILVVPRELFQATWFGSFAMHAIEASRYFVPSYETVVIQPMALLGALTPYLVNVKDARIGFHTNLLGSIKDNSSGGLYNLRASYSALHSALRSLGRDFKNGTIIAIHLGMFFPGLEKNSIISARDAAALFVSCLMSTPQSLSGRAVFATTGQPMAE